MTRYIILRKPSDINLPSKRKEIISHLSNGCKTSDILLQLEFVAPDEVINNIVNKFKVIRNQSAFSLDTRYK